MPLPAVFELHLSTVAPPPWAVPVPLASSVQGPNRAIKGSLPPTLFDRLQSEAAHQLWRTLVTSPEVMPVLSPMGNWPRPEVFFNTAVKRQHSRPCAAARAAPQGLQRLCAGCWSGAGPRGAQCDVGGQCCPGCESCVGRAFLCPACGVTFERRWVYESGSGIGSIGRAPDRFEVFPFTSAQEAAAQQLDNAESARTSQPPRRPLRSCVRVAYLGADFCAACALGQPHGSKQCGSVLHFHKDRAGGGNSQAATINHTISLGAPRTLRMELHLPLAGADGASSVRGRGRDGGGSGCFTYGTGPGAAVHFDLTHGSEFTLQPCDEEVLPREVGDGSIAMGSFYHGMVQEVGAHSVSCALVFRDVTVSAEVDVASNCVLQTAPARRQLNTGRLPRGLANQPGWVPAGFRGTRAQALALTRQWWSSNAQLYAAKMQPVLRRALAEWTSADRADRMGRAGGGGGAAAAAAAAAESEDESSRLHKAPL